MITDKQGHAPSAACPDCGAMSLFFKATVAGGPEEGYRIWAWQFQCPNCDKPFYPRTAADIRWEVRV